MINDCRKSGLLPVDFTAADESRRVEGLQGYIDTTTPEDEAENIVEGIWGSVYSYNPIDFWDGKPFYVEMVVEKIDLKSIFEPVCRHYHVPITNAKGWADINSRAGMMRRFARHEAAGRECVLLMCNVHDPGGLSISNTMLSNLTDLSEAVGWNPSALIIDRFGLNADFIEDHNLSWIDNLETSSGKRLDDPRHKDHRKSYVQSYLKKYGARKCEANALVVDIKAGRELCQQAIEAYITADDISDYDRQTHERRELVAAALPEALKAAADEL